MSMFDHPDKIYLFGPEQGQNAICRYVGIEMVGRRIMYEPEGDNPWAEVIFLERSELRSILETGKFIHSAHSIMLNETNRFKMLSAVFPQNGWQFNKFFVTASKDIAQGIWYDLATPLIVYTVNERSGGLMTHTIYGGFRTDKQKAILEAHKGIRLFMFEEEAMRFKAEIDKKLKNETDCLTTMIDNAIEKYGKKYPITGRLKHLKTLNGLELESRTKYRLVRDGQITEKKVTPRRKMNDKYLMDEYGFIIDFTGNAQYIKEHEVQYHMELQKRKNIEYQVEKLHHIKVLMRNGMLPQSAKLNYEVVMDTIRTIERNNK